MEIQDEPETLFNRDLNLELLNEAHGYWDPKKNKMKEDGVAHARAHIRSMTRETNKSVVIEVTF